MISKELVAASTKPLVLSILSDGESYGYEIIQKVRKLSGEDIEWTEGMLYPVLHRMERDELIESFWHKAETGRKRKYYRIKRQGKTALKTEQTQWLTVHRTFEKLWNLNPNHV
jgi:PadR family transcriptional regulator, regulatory protein PadR